MHISTHNHKIISCAFLWRKYDHVLQLTQKGNDSHGVDMNGGYALYAAVLPVSER